jgi:hypothetical protein
MGTEQPQSDKTGQESVEEKVKKLEERLDNLLSGKVELKVMELSDLQVSPRSKLRVACE